MSWIETYQNIANLFVCGGVSATLYAYYNISEQYLNYAIPLVSAHFITDLFLTKKTDLMIHHLLGLSFIAYKYMIPVYPPDDTSTILVMYKTEISTVFYVFKLLLQNTKYKKIALLNDLLFFATFFKFRIYDFYHILINDHTMYTDYSKYDYLYIIIGAIHGMFILNLYWFLIICKITLKPLLKLCSQQFSEYLCHYITSYTMPINLLINIYLYSLEFNSIYWYNIYGLIAVAIASYNYHTYAYTLINQHKYVCYTSADTFFLFLQDIGAIHFCSFTALLTNYGVADIVYLSAGLHTICYFINLAHLYYSKNTTTITYGNTGYNMFVSLQYLCIILPNSLDIILIVANSFDSAYSIHGLYISILLLLIFIVNPLYDLTHILFHICLIIQCICCSKCNMYVMQG